MITLEFDMVGLTAGVLVVIAYYIGLWAGQREKRRRGVKDNPEPSNIEQPRRPS